MASTPTIEGGASALPPMPDAALLLGQTLRCLNGSLIIDTRGKRQIGFPLCFDEGFPQLPDAEFHEQFRTSEEMRGAFKLLTGVMRRLCEADQELMFLMLADCGVEECGLIPSIEEPRRRQ